MNTDLIFKAKTFDELTTAELYEIVRARTEIFLLEQKIICQNFDGIDYDSLHCFLEKGGKVVAYLRAFSTRDGAVKLGRVLSITHGVGLGGKLMTLSLPEIERKWQGARITLHAQTHAQGFYEKWNFATTSAEFLEEGIPHITMERRVPHD